MADAWLQEVAPASDLARPALTVVQGGRTAPQTAQTPTEAQLIDVLPSAFARFCELCPERGMVDRRGLIQGVLSLAQAAHPGATFAVPGSDTLDLPIASLVRDALWHAGRSGRLEPLRAALAQAQLRLTLCVV